MLETAKKGAQSKSLRPASAIERGLPQTKQHTLKENKAAMKIHVQVFMRVFMSLGSMLRGTAAGSQGKHIFSFLTSYPTMFQLATHFAVPPKCMKSSFPKILPIFKSTSSYSWHFSRSVADLISVPTVLLASDPDHIPFVLSRETSYSFVSNWTASYHCVLRLLYLLSSSVRMWLPSVLYTSVVVFPHFPTLRQDLM